MVVLVVRIADNVVMPLRQDSPAHKPGGMTLATIQGYGGTPRDYFEIAIPPEHTAGVLQAKELAFDPKTLQVTVTPYTQEEIEVLHKKQELDQLEAQVERERKRSARIDELKRELAHEAESSPERPSGKSAHTTGAQSSNRRRNSRAGLATGKRNR